MFRASSLAALLALAAAALPANGADSGYLLRAGGYYSDNLGRQPSDGQIDKDLVGVAGVALDVARDQGVAQGHLLADLAYYDYHKQGYQNDLLGNVTATGSLQVVPRNFIWTADLTYGQARRDLLQPVQPGNLENVLQLATGPKVTLDFSDATALEIKGTASKIVYESREFNSTTVGGQAVLVHNLTDHLRAGLGGSLDAMDYQRASAVPDLKREEAFLRVDVRGVRTTILLDAGVARLKGGSIDDNSAVTRLRATRRISPYLDGYVSVERQYPTVTQPGILAGQGPAPAPGDQSVLTAGPRRTDSIAAGLLYTRPRTEFDLSYALHRDVSLQQVDGKWTVNEVRASLQRFIGTRMAAGAFASASYEHFSPNMLSVHETAFGAFYTVSLGHALGVDLVAQQHDRTGSSLLAPYSEFQVGAYLRWGTLKRRSITH